MYYHPVPIKEVIEGLGARNLLGEDIAMVLESPSYTIGGDSIEGSIHIGLESSNLLAVLESVTNTILIVAGGGSVDIAPYAGAVLTCLSVFSFSNLSPSADIKTILGYNNNTIFPPGGAIMSRSNLPGNLANLIFGQEEYQIKRDSGKPAPKNISEYLRGGSLYLDVGTSVVRMVYAPRIISGVLPKVVNVLTSSFNPGVVERLGAFRMPLAEVPIAPAV